MKYDLLDQRFWTPTMLPSVSLEMVIGAVAIDSGKGIGWKAYIGYGYGDDEDYDAQLIAANGTKLEESVARALFPDQKGKYLK